MKQYINHLDDLLAHTKNGRKETLFQHSQKTLFYFQKLEKEKHLNPIIKQTISRITFKEDYLNETVKEYIYNMFVQAIYLHDIGKINPNFQLKKLKNKIVQGFNYYDTNHSMLSAVVYLDLFWWEIENLNLSRKEIFILRYFAFSFSYCISRHHSQLLNVIGNDKEEKTYINEIENFYDKLRDHPELLRYYKHTKRILDQFPLEKIRNTQKKVYGYLSEFTVFVLNKLCYSSIVSCDFFATQSFMANQDVDIFSLKKEDKVSLFNCYAETSVYQSIQRYKNNKSSFSGDPINKLRSDLFIEADENLQNNLNNHLFFLEAPTGSGKTNTSINLALSLLNNDNTLQKMIYVFPFNTLIEQTKNTLVGIYPQELQKKYPISVINSIEPIINKTKEKQIDETVDYENELLKYQTIQYPFILTSHVNLFNHFFGTNREANLGLVHLSNSVIVLDEIQSYKNELWPAIAELLSEFAHCLNLKIIIMSATLPRIDEFLPDEKHFINLIKNRDYYFNHPLFKERVRLNFELLHLPREELFDRFCEFIDEQGSKRYLFEFIYRSVARDFYDKFCEKYPDKLVVELTGDDNNFYRKEMIDQLNSETKNSFTLKDIIVVATQVIEAGVDIDMDIGFKDISLFDSEEQFLGRINRSCKREGLAYFFNYSDASVLYKKDARLEHDLMKPEYQQALVEKNFKPLYEMAFEWLRPNRNDNLYSQFKALRYKDVETSMRLIDQITVTIYLPYKLKTKDKVIDGEKLWKDYKYLIWDNQLSYAEKKIKLSQKQVEISYFTYTLYLKPGEIPLYSDECIGNIYYISSGSRYMKKDKNTGYYKFDRNKYEQDSGSEFF
ncbi:CRISPR-associated helicase Cas3' [Terrilactibacillus sp. BCM23-1]|uniref:CRISPR-associated helicase Cas3 n=1 Tax=Terrilactibacillus tamarindi TaxID=2599694 RepID=A0A6N8CR22_9BACI|nr:CRISPR-associated helicase Cas3' [Terrilactibacillus tamarindi]MTT31375.1 CRISPR-associated helicase Cas3' [Terrilactibacillus tamarindi]